MVNGIFSSPEDKLGYNRSRISEITVGSWFDEITYLMSIIQKLDFVFITS